MKLHLSKSKYCNAVQCPKMLWMQTNRPELFDDSVMNQDAVPRRQRLRLPLCPSYYRCGRRPGAHKKHMSKSENSRPLKRSGVFYNRYVTVPCPDRLYGFSDCVRNGNADQIALDKGGVKDRDVTVAVNIGGS